MPHFTDADLRELSAEFPRMTNTRDLGVGTAFPSSADLAGGLQTGDQFFRTDLGWHCFYDGTRWLTCHEYEINLTPFGNPFPYSTAAAATLLLSPSRNDRDYYITGARVYTLVNTTNNGTNYWSFELKDDNAVTLWSFNTAAGSAGSGQLQAQGVIGQNTITNFFNLNTTGKTGSPGALATVNLTLWFRLVVP